MMRTMNDEIHTHTMIQLRIEQALKQVFSTK